MTKKYEKIKTHIDEMVDKLQMDDDEEEPGRAQFYHQSLVNMHLHSHILVEILDQLERIATSMEGKKDGDA